MDIRKIVAGAVLAAGMFFSIPAYADYYPAVHHVNNRYNYQHTLAVQGVNNGTISEREKRNLQRQSKTFKAEERLMRLDGKGHLSAADQYIINSQLNRTRREIYRYKHN